LQSSGSFTYARRISFALSVFTCIFGAQYKTITHMMFENLSDKLERSFKLLKGQGKITEINIAETLKEIRRALLDADVNFKIAKTFTDEVKEKAIGQNVLSAVKPGELMVKIVRDELVELMGGESAGIDMNGSPVVILMAGLQGSGKTTFREIG
jgi:signal recognition particle subunit SRP54